MAICRNCGREFDPRDGRYHFCCRMCAMEHHDKIRRVTTYESINELAKLVKDDPNAYAKLQKMKLLASDKKSFIIMPRKQGLTQVQEQIKEFHNNLYEWDNKKEK